MNIEMLQENLARGVDIVSVLCESVGQPWSKNVLIETVENKIRLTAANLEAAVVCHLGARISKSGGMVVPTRRFRDLVDVIEHGRLTLMSGQPWADGETQNLKLEVGREKHNLRGATVRTFAELDFPTESKLQIEHSLLARAIKRCAFAVGKDDQRPVLSGVSITQDEEGVVRMVGSDGFRMGMHVLGSFPAVVPKGGWLLPGAPMQRLPAKIGRSKADALVPVVANEKRVGFDFGAAQFYFQLMQFDLPAFRSIVPTTHITSFTVETADMRRALRSAGAIGRYSDRSCRFLVEPDESRVLVSARSDQEGDCVTDIELTEVAGDGLRVALSTAFVKDGLDVMDTRQVKFEFGRPRDPVIMRPVGDEEAYLYLIMPMEIPDRTEVL